VCHPSKLIDFSDGGLAAHFKSGQVLIFLGEKFQLDLVATRRTRRLLPLLTSTRGTRLKVGASGLKVMKIGARWVPPGASVMPPAGCG
jgi:hypothetical protein